LPRTADNNRQIKFSSLLSRSQIICALPSGSRDEAIMTLLKRLDHECGVGNVEEALEAIIAREESHPTVINTGIALPHARLDAVRELVVGIGTSRERHRLPQSWRRTRQAGRADPRSQGRPGGVPPSG